MPDYNQMLYAIEVHSVDGIKQYFEQGGNPNEIHNGVPLFTTMVEMYTRTPRFAACVKTFINHGLIFEEKALLAVLIDDVGGLEKILKEHSSTIAQTYYLHNNTYSSLRGATLLHYCAEYNSVACAKVLVKNGADINARAATNEFGFDGQTPIFHTVNQNMNNSEGMLKLLLESKADLSYTVKGLLWGRGYEWETFIPAVNPLNYAAMGLLPQIHRDPLTVANTISLLLKYAYGIDFVLPNVPNAYLTNS